MACVPNAAFLAPVVLFSIETDPNAALNDPVVPFPFVNFKALFPTAVLSVPAVFVSKALTPNAVFELSPVLPLPTVNPLTVKSALNVLAPAKVCAAVVTTPPFVPSAGARFKTPDVILAPLAVELALIAPMLVTPAGVAHDGTPDAKVNT